MKKSLLILASFVLFTSATTVFAQTTTVTTSDQPMMCTAQYDPVCAKAGDGTIKTYGNACTANAEKASFLYKGECGASNSLTVPTTDLWIGIRNENVTTLQNYLIAKVTGPAASALQSVGATGYFGSLTRAALAEYQNAHAITPTHGYFGPKTRAVMNASATVSTATFTGKISAVSTSCFADGICSVTIDGKKVILLAGMRMGDTPPVGTLKGVDSIGDLENKIGESAEVYAAAATEDGADYTLYGNSSYYVKVLGK